MKEIVARPDLDLERAVARIEAIVLHLGLILEVRGLRPANVMRPEILELIAQIDRRLVDRYGEDYSVRERGSQIVAAFDRRFATAAGALYLRERQERSST